LSIPDGKLSYYYWRICELLSEHADLLDVKHECFRAPDEDQVIYLGYLSARLVFKDGSCLVVETQLDATAAVREFDYAYVYLSPDGGRIFQYDDAPHHAHIPTHPHHRHVGPVPTEGKDEPLPSDLPQVDFFTIFAKIVTEYFTKRGK